MVETTKRVNEESLVALAAIQFSPCFGRKSVALVWWLGSQGVGLMSPTPCDLF